MALGDPYATPEQLEARLGRADSDEYGENYARILDAASRAVESFTRRQFNRDDDEYPSARRFRALDPMRVAVDDFHTLEDLTVEVNGVLWDTSHIDARPWDGMRHGQINWPYSDLFAISRRFPWSRRALVTVWAHWGWAEVPAAIIEATLDVAEAMASSGAGAGSGPVRSETIGGYSISYAIPGGLTAGADVPPEMVKAIPFRRKVFGVA